MADNYLARRQGEWLVISLTPDVCKTPVGSSTPPIPYPVIAKLETSASVVSSVRANGHPAVVFNQSFIPATLGDALGVANGIKSGTVGGKCYPKEHSGSVCAGKKRILRHGDKFWMNGR